MNDVKISQFLYQKSQPANKKLINTKTELPFFNGSFDKTHIKELVSWFLDNYGEYRTINFLENLKYYGFDYATKAGISLGIEDLQIPPQKSTLITEAYITSTKIQNFNRIGLLTSVEKSQYLIDTWNQTSDILRQTAIQNFRLQNPVNPIYMMAFSGARGNVSQVRQLVAMRGLMADPQGAILEFPIQSNFREGLTITEYLISCYGARKGLVDTALRTATSGYLTRRLVDSAQHAVVSMLDCKTERGILLKGKGLESRLIGRVLAKSLPNSLFTEKHIVSVDEAKIISQTYKQIFVRSPLTCDSNTSICQLCYGWDLASGKLVQIGEAVGVIAAQSIGEPGTQLTMRTFHTGGVGVFSDQALKPIIAPYTGKIIFEKPIPGHFIRTPHGKVAYIIKPNAQNTNDILLRIKPLEFVKKEFIIREQDLLPGSLIFVRNGELVFARQLIAQISHLKISKQRLPESSHPVYATQPGQIFFESMTLSIEQEYPIDSDQSVFLENKLPVLNIRRMTKIGSFWVLAASNQYKLQINNCFIEKGDLVSMTTRLFGYKFYSDKQVQIYTSGSKLLFGKAYFEFPINDIYFNNQLYIFNVNTIRNSMFAFYKQNKQLSKIFFYFRPIHSLNCFELNNDNYSFFHIFDLYLNRNLNYSQYKIPPSPNKGQVFSKLKTTLNLPVNILKRACYRYKLISPNFIKNNQIEKIKFNTLTSFIKKISNDNSSKISLLDNINRTELTQNKINNFLKKISKKDWIYIPRLLEEHTFCFQQTRLAELTFGQRPTRIKSKIIKTKQHEQHFLPIGSKFSEFYFPTINITINNFCMRNYKKQKLLIKNIALTIDYQHLINARTWYKKTQLLESSWLKNVQIYKVRIKTKHDQFVNYNSRKFQTNKYLGLIWYKSQLTNIKAISNLENTLNYRSQIYISFKKFYLLQKLTEFNLPNSNLVRKNISKVQFRFPNFSPKNPLGNKQIKTAINSEHKNYNFSKILIPRISGFYSPNTLIKYDLNISQNTSETKYELQYKTVSKNLNRGLTIFKGYFATFKNPTLFSFQTFLNNWVLPAKAFTVGHIKINTNGEFRYKEKTSTGTSISILHTKNCLILKNSQTKDSTTNIGDLIRFGDEIIATHANITNGQILAKDKVTLLIRLGYPVLASARGIIHVSQDNLVKKDQLLITLKSRRLQTEDIVQGIPKIEQLFEARESQSGEILFDTVHLRLKNAFVRELEVLDKNDWAGAVERSFLEAQEFLVENILDAYSNQGVKISEKHVEVIVRQMTSRVRVLEAGETGLLPGELVQHSWIIKFNKYIRKIGLREATYEPIVLGISKSVLQSESFLLAASFQEVSRVLVRSALSKKQDFLRGLHENVIVGQLIPAGTGLIKQVNSIT